MIARYPGVIEYEIQTAVKQAGGNVLVTNEKMHVSNATEATLYLSIGTNFKDYQTVDGDPR